MNTRIVEMAEEAAEYALLNQSGEALVSEAEGCDEICVSREFIEKFAELLVKECIDTIQNESMDSGDEWEDGLRIAEGAIREHFGVEE